MDSNHRGMKNHYIYFSNGVTERRFASPVAKPDIIFAAMEGQRWAPETFRLPWNQCSDVARWKIIIVSEDGERHEEPARV
jgi:hypothetical protein